MKPGRSGDNLRGIGRVLEPYLEWQDVLHDVKGCHLRDSESCCQQKASGYGVEFKNPAKYLNVVTQ